MKRIITLLAGFLFLTTTLLAQDKRPDNIGVGDFDSFKNSAYDSQDESLKLKTNTEKIDKEIKGYSGVLSTISGPKLREDLNALIAINKSQKELRQQLGALDDKGKSLLGSAKNVSPKLKAPAATNNTKKSITALDNTRKNLDGISGLLSADSKILIDELKKRGETVEVFD
jgi:hypothetical protein